jgi:hypothetical protein
MSSSRGMTKLPSVMSALGQVVPDVRLRYESLDGKHTSAWKVTVRSVNATSCKEASRAKAHHQIVRCRELGRRLADYHPSRTTKHIARTCNCFSLAVDDGGARVPTSDQQKRRRCVGGRSNKSTPHSQKKHPESERFGVERGSRKQKRVCESGSIKKGPRAAIGKKRADGQKVFTRKPSSRQGPYQRSRTGLLAKLDMRFCCRGGLVRQMVMV